MFRRPHTDSNARAHTHTPCITVAHLPAAFTSTADGDISPRARSHTHTLLSFPYTPIHAAAAACIDKMCCNECNVHLFYHRIGLQFENGMGMCGARIHSSTHSLTLTLARESIAELTDRDRWRLPLPFAYRHWQDDCERAIDGSRNDIVSDSLSRALR